jgi:YD repeat-containing protein
MNSYNETALKSMSSNTSTYDIVNPLHGSQYSEKYLQSIIFDDGSHVIFDRLSELRKDLKNAESLHSISIYNSTSSQPIRTFVFNTDYFTSDALASEGFMKTLSDDEYTFYRKRLKLISVTEENGSDISKYQFEYSNINLPPKDSYNQDHWGFYNGASNTMLLPSFQGTLEYQELYNKQILSGFPGLGSNQILILQSERKYAEYTGANRESNKDYMPACILKKIIYPTGGSTEFEFEANEYSNINDSRDDNYTYTDFTASYEVLCSTTGSPIITKTFNYPYTFSSDVMDIVNPVVNMVIMPWNVTNYNECSPSFLPSGDYFEINLGARDYYGTSFTYHKTFPFDDPDQNPSTANPDNCLRSYTFSLDGQNTYTGPLNMNISIANTLEGKRAILNFSGKLKKYVTTGTYQKKTGGGLRVKKIKHSDGYDSSKDIIKKYSYGYDTTLSNGTIENITYGILKTHVRNYSVKLNYPDNNTSAWSDIRFTSSNIHSMSYSQNNLIGYSKITEYLGENGESGSTEYDYNNFPDFLFDQKTRPPGVPNSTKILYDGKLLTKTMYDNNNHKVYLEHNNYTLLDEHIIRGMFQDRFRFVSGAGEGFLQVGNGCLHYYPVFARWEALDNKTERTFNPSTGQYLETLISYTYNSTNLLPKTVFTYSSKGDNLITKNFYPTDVTTVNSLPGGALSTNELNYINQLKGIYNNNIVSFKTGEIIQKEEWKQDVLLTRQRTNYNLFNNIILPETVEFATADNPLENRLIYSNYDSKGNLLEVSKSDDVKVTYIWGYNQSYPVVKIEGKSYNDIQSIRTIIEGHPFSGKTDFTSIKADRDFLNTQLLSLLIDPACMVTYYTYAPLIGMTSQSDPNGVTTYFEYDFFGRLKLVRDNDGNILKTYDYHYKE